MEMYARFAHKVLWHDFEPGWALHKSHHEPRTGPFELNDIYAVANALPAMALCAYGFFTPHVVGAVWDRGDEGAAENEGARGAGEEVMEREEGGWFLEVKAVDAFVILRVLHLGRGGGIPFFPFPTTTCLPPIPNPQPRSAACASARVWASRCSASPTCSSTTAWCTAASPWGPSPT